MISVTITPVYVALTALLMLVLSVKVSKMRLKHGVSLGDGGEAAVNLAIRGFGNLTEYAPIILALLLMMELQGIGAIWLHAFGIAFLVARVMHPLALYDQRSAPKWKLLTRQFAATATLVLLLVGGLTVLYSALSSMI